MSMSAKKRHRQDARNKVANNFLQSRARTALKRALHSLANDTDQVSTHVTQFKSFIDIAARKGGIHPRKAARLKSRLEIKVARKNNEK